MTVSGVGGTMPALRCVGIRVADLSWSHDASDVIFFVSYKYLLEDWTMALGIRTKHNLKQEKRLTVLLHRSTGNLHTTDATHEFGNWDWNISGVAIRMEWSVGALEPSFEEAYKLSSFFSSRVSGNSKKNLMFFRLYKLTPTSNWPPYHSLICSLADSPLPP